MGEGQMDWFVVAAILLTLLPVGLRFTGKPAGRAFVRAEGAVEVLGIFAVIVAVYGAFAAYHYWSVLKAHGDDLMYALGLGLVMVFGMFVQVISENRRQQRKWADIDAGQLLYPLLFSIVVFYPIWLLAANAPKNFFVVHAAFLNGYFWEGIVSEAKRPNPGANNQPPPNRP
jgi:hypothetical protein